MAYASEDARDGLPRDGAEASPSRVVVPPKVPAFHRPPVELDGIARSTTIRLWCSDFWKLGIGRNHETGLWLTEAGVDALIGELLAAREQFRMEREAGQQIAALVESLGGSADVAAKKALLEVPW